jgi:hypothetical protein
MLEASAAMNSPRNAPILRGAQVDETELASSDAIVVSPGGSNPTEMVLADCGSAKGQALVRLIRSVTVQFPGAFTRCHRSPDSVWLRRSERMLATLLEDGAAEADPFGCFLATMTPRLERLLREEHVERIADAIAPELPVPRFLDRRRQPQTVGSGE